ncbi:MAG TPA: hypothetical protein VMM80_04590, partial [Bacteroidota bacterium]|nr:hypothetical protein [Bacteroidota bacterium]
EKGTVTPELFRRGVREIAERWAPATWIDHGNTIRYCYSMGGAADPAYDLLGELRAARFTTLWSYHDAYAHGCATLNLLDAPVSGAGRMVLRSASHMLRGEILIALHYVRSIMERWLRGKWSVAVLGGITALRSLGMGVRGGRRISAGAVKGALDALRTAVRRAGSAGAGGSREPYTRRELAALGAAVYPERAVPLQQAEWGDLSLFATIEGVHTRDIYTPRALNRLVAERGLHIGHTYLLNDLPYIAGLFARGTGAGRISAEWMRFVDSLAHAVASGSVWNPPAGELTRWMMSLERVAVVPAGTHRLHIVNSAPAPVTDFTLLLPRTARGGTVLWSEAAPRGSRDWRDWCAVWGDLPAGSTTIVEWDADAR